MTQSRGNRGILAALTDDMPVPPFGRLAWAAVWLVFLG